MGTRCSDNCLFEPCSSDNAPSGLKPKLLKPLVDKPRTTRKQNPSCRQGTRGPTRQAPGGDSESLTTTAHAPRAIPNLWFNARGGGGAPLSPPRDQGPIRRVLGGNSEFHTTRVSHPGQSRFTGPTPRGSTRFSPPRDQGPTRRAPTTQTTSETAYHTEGLMPEYPSTYKILWTLRDHRSRT